ncbi:hypothetical protein L596_017031 [Steinernema carpocapsae]|uniref:Uncharacterized protein n=1 Tax=Steinernema carpocapsae TaxID=34508 RepID=A0A4U5N0A7_STECR|nr:hypothetical protein L596_017031 [Steinernema carpocapsae]
MKVQDNFYAPFRTTSSPQERDASKDETCRQFGLIYQEWLDQNQTTGYLPTDHFKKMSQLFESAHQTFLLEEPDPNEWHESIECKTSWNLCRLELLDKPDFIRYLSSCLYTRTAT